MNFNMLIKRCLTLFLSMSSSNAPFSKACTITVNIRGRLELFSPKTKGLLLSIRSAKYP
ncbi:unnamed protein product [Brugia timori]|uniref:Secreted protein n=1 Tax=Brugia timori TaxID=42155 RepID=A0A0R3RCZ5_9BILA|nr:unnamed protein product [Brugia timori]